MVRASDRIDLPHRSHDFRKWAGGLARHWLTERRRSRREGLGSRLARLPLCDSRGDDGIVRQVSISSGVGVHASERWQPILYDAYLHVMRVRAAAVCQNSSICSGRADRESRTPHHQCCAVDAGFDGDPPAQVESGRWEQGLPSMSWARMLWIPTRHRQPPTTARNGT